MVGANGERAAEVLRRIYAPLTSGEYYKGGDALPGACSAERPAKLLVTSAQSAEIIKHASNAFRALKISFINAVSNLAEAVDADIEDIALRYNIRRRARQWMWCRRRRQARRLGMRWWFSWHSAVGIGSYLLPDTDDIRESPAIEVIRKLLDAGASVTAYDPAAMERTREVLPESSKMSYASDAYEAAKDADAVLILTEWREFAELDLTRLDQALKYPIVIDGRNLYTQKGMEEHGFTYVSMGRPATYQAQQGKPRNPVV